MTIEWMTTAALVIKEQELVIAFDPFLELQLPGIRLHTDAGKEYSAGSPADRYRQASHVFVTHGHFDHILSIPEIYRGSGAVIHSTRTPLRSLRKSGVPEKQLSLICPGDIVRLRCGPDGTGLVEVEAFQGRHCRFDAGIIRKTVLSKRFFRYPGRMLKIAALSCRFRENGEILVYEIRCGGKRIQIMGSMNLDPAVDYPGEADLLILPLQGRSDQDTYALGIVERLRPRRVLLDHYDDSFPPMSSRVDTAGFEKNLAERSIRCEKLVRGTIIEI